MEHEDVRRAAHLQMWQRHVEGKSAHWIEETIVNGNNVYPYGPTLEVDELAILLDAHPGEPGASALFSLLRKACELGRDDLARFLLVERGVDPNHDPIPYQPKDRYYTSKRCYTPLVLAVRNGKADCVRLLIASGANVDATHASHHATTILWHFWDNPDNFGPPLYRFFVAENAPGNGGFIRFNRAQVDVCRELLAANPRDNPLRRLDTYTAMRVIGFLWQPVD